MNKRLLTAVSFAALAALLITFFAVDRIFLAEKSVSVEEYEAFLLEHPYYKQKERAAKHVEGEEKKRDRPDLRMQQDFLMTMDPALRRPTPEKLPVILEEAKKARTQGTLPGEATAAWVERGPNNVGGRTRALMWDPNDATGKKVWAAGVSGGLWYNNDITSASSSWVAVDNFWSNLAVSCIAYDPNNTQVFYVGTGEGFAAGGGSGVRGLGIWRSADGGQTWTQLAATADFYFVSDLVVRNESGASVVYAGLVGKYIGGQWFSDKEGLYRSADNGGSFTQVLPNVSGQNYPPGVGDIELAQDNTLWVGTYSSGYGAGGGSVMSSADGLAWTVKYSAAVSELSGRVELATAPSNAALVYALIENDNKIFQMKVSGDAGATWANMTFPDDDDTGIDASDFTRGQAWYDLIAAVDPVEDSTIVIGGINLHRSTNAGQTWQQISKWSNNANMGDKSYSYVHADMHAIQFKPGSSSEVVFGTDGGVFYSNAVQNAATSNVISARNNNYNVTQFYAGAIHPNKGKHYFLAGAQDNGTQRFNAEGMNATVDVYGGDGAFCFIDQTDGTNQIVSYVYNDYSFSDSDWTTPYNHFSSDDASGHFINPADYDDEQNILFSAATESTLARFFKTTGGFTRSDLTVQLGTKASIIKVSPHTRTSSTLFVGTSAGKLYRITGAESDAAVVTNITGASFPAGWISCIEVGQTENHLLVTFSNYGVNSVWYSTNGGSSWTSKEGNLPDMPVRWAMFNPTNFDEVILATEMGIWGTKSLAATTPVWAQFSNGLANVRVDMLQMRASDYEVIAVTHGRGLFSSSIFASQATLSANFVAKNRKADVGGAILFTDLSTGASGWEWTFEGGTPATSTSQNPLVTYLTEGAYSVTLKAKGAGGTSATKTISGYIAIGDQSGTGGCSGSKTLTAVNGTVADGSGDNDYGHDLSCEWLIKPAGASSINITFSAFNTEADYDFLYIYKGTEANETAQVGKYSGTSIPAPLAIDTGVVLIKFTSDADMAAAGWAFTYTSDGLAAPSNLTATALSARKTELSWGDNSSDETGFAIERSTDGTTFTQLTTVSPNTVSYTDTGLEPETSYYYKVKTVKGEIASDFSNLALATTLVKGNPDITLTNLQGDFVNNGKDIEITYNLINTTEEAASGFEITFYLSDDETADPGDVVLGTSDIALLSPESENAHSDEFEMTILPAGEYFILAVADEANTVVEENEGNNTATAAIVVSAVLGAAAEPGALIRVFPNPSAAWVSVELPHAPAEEVTLQLSDLSGKVWVQEKTRSKTTRFDMGALKKGVYILTVGNHSQRVIRE